MRMISWIILLVITSLIALVLVLTFLQPAFTTMVPMQILTHKTQPIAVYIYVIGAFTIGLTLGMITAGICQFRAFISGSRKNHRIRDLERMLEDAKTAAAVPLAPIPTASPTIVSLPPESPGA